MDKDEVALAEDPATIDKEIRELEEDTDYCSEADDDDDLDTLIEDQEHVLRRHADNSTDDIIDHDALYDGNLAPPEYYRQGIQTLDLDDYQRKEYSKGTEQQILKIERQWQTYVAGSC